jgi:hypothetical protein
MRRCSPCSSLKTAQEAMRIVAEKKRGELKYENAAKDIANFVANADLMDQRRRITR